MHIIEESYLQTFSHSLEKIQAAFADFKKEALQRKKAVKTGTASPKEFTDWLYQQSDIILKLTTF